MSIILIIKIPQHFAIVTIAVIVMCILTIAMVVPQAAYATQDEENKPQSSDDEDCGSDEVPASIDGTIECMGEGECNSYEFNGKEIKRCNS